MTYHEKITDFGRLLMLFVWRSAVDSGTAQEANERRQDYLLRYGEDPQVAYDRWQREATG